MTNILRIRSIKTIGITVLLISVMAFSFFPGILNIHAAQTPSVNTHGASEIGTTSARINGDFNPHGAPSQGWFEWGTTSALGNSTTRTDSSSPRTFDRTLSGLSPNTTYFFRAVAENSRGREHGQIRSFVTGAEILLASVHGELYCATRTVDSIVIGYNFSGGNNVSLFRENTRINTWNQRNTSGRITDRGLSDGVSYRYDLRDGNSLTSPLIDSILCRTETRDGRFEDLSIRNLVRIDNDTHWRESVTVPPNSIIEFLIEIRSTGSAPMHNVLVRNILPERIEYHGTPRVDGSVVAGNLEAGLNIGTIPAGSIKTVTFKARVLSEDLFGIGSTNLVNSAFAASGGKNVNDTAGVFVVRGVVAGVATNIKTGITDNNFIDFFLLPLLLTIIIFFLFKKHFSGLAEWMDGKKSIVMEKRAEKRLCQIRELAKLKEKLN